MVVVLGKWQRPKEFKELVRIKSNKKLGESLTERWIYALEKG